MSERGFEEGADEGLWNIFLTSILGLTGGVAADRTDDAVEVEAVGGTTDALEEIDVFFLFFLLPLT